MGKMYWQKTSQMQTEKGLQMNIEEPQMVKSLIKSLLTYIEVIVCVLLLECLSREFFILFKSPLIYFRGMFNCKHI